MVEPKKPLQQGVEDSLLGHYYDIMVIGKTGSGKSTTVDKLLIASLPGQQWQKDLTHQQFAHPGGEVVHNTGRRMLTCQNMVMWLASDKDLVIENMSIRLKNLVFYSSLENPHEEVNSAHNTEMHIHKSTTDCELLSNELTKVRVLDVPGFFGENAAAKDAGDPASRMRESAETDLSTMRKILRIKNTHNLKFNRIIYFLPERGALKRTSQALIAEVGIMKKFFGRPIFDSMVVVATLSPDAYDFIEDKGQDLFPEVRLQQTRKYFNEALKIFFESEEIPEPPIIFISLFDTCEKILEKIQNAGVKEDAINLEFESSICARCDVKIIAEGTKGADVFACALPDQSGLISSEESTCHPMMIPKYSKVKKIFGGIAHLITFRRFVGKWPNFESMDEVCISCRGPPNTRGCMRVGEEYKCGGGSITVNHSTSAVEHLQIEVEAGEDEDQAEDPPPQGGQGEDMRGAPSEHQGIHYVFQAGREVYRQEPSVCSAPRELSPDMKG